MIHSTFSVIQFAGNNPIGIGKNLIITALIFRFDIVWFCFWLISLYLALFCFSIWAYVFWFDGICDNSSSSSSPVVSLPTCAFLGCGVVVFLFIRWAGVMTLIYITYLHCTIFEEPISGDNYTNIFTLQCLALNCQIVNPVSHVQMHTQNSAGNSEEPSPYVLKFVAC